jgi:hypothetical protein
MWFMFYFRSISFVDYFDDLSVIIVRICEFKNMQVIEKY